MQIIETKRLEVNPTIYNEYKDKPDAHLQSWFMENRPKEEMRYKEAAERQIMFVRDDIRYLFKDDVYCVEVISTHTSKSVKLPVYHLVLNNGFEVIMRGNFHNWVISIISPFPIELPNEILNSEYNEQIEHVYCEGFQKDWVFNPYPTNRRKFTVQISSQDHVLWAFFFLIKVQLNKYAF